MIQEVAAVSPQEYERQQKDDLASSGGVRNTAKFVEALADRSGCCAPPVASLPGVYHSTLVFCRMHWTSFVD
jgi:hypothetical protein